MKSNSSTPVSSELSVLYALPIPRFFSQCGGIGGHIAHAQGIMKSFSATSTTLDVLAEEAPADTMDFVDNWHNLPCPNTLAHHRFLWSFRFNKKIAALISRTDYSICYMRFSTQFAPLIPALKKILGDIPLVLELNSFGSQHGAMQRLLLAPLESRALKAADLTLCVSDSLLKDVRRLLGPGAAKGCFVVPNGVDPDRFSPTYENQGQDRPISLCYCGILKADYGLENLLAAHKELEKAFPELTLHILGDGPHRRALESAPRQGKNVVFHGAVGFNEVPTRLAQMDILVYTTAQDKIFQSPIKLYEYMCTGRPIVAADTPQTRQVLTEKQPCGLLYAVEDTSQFIETIRRLLVDPSQGRELAHNARQAVEDNHTWIQRVTTLKQELSRRGLLGV